MNAAHQLRQKMLDLRTQQITKEIPSYNFEEEQFVPPPASLLKEYKAPLDVQVFSGRVNRHNRIRAQKKGKPINLNADMDKEANLQEPDDEYMDFEDMLENLCNKNDHEERAKKDNKTWGKLTDDEKAEKLVEFAKSFEKKGMTEETSDKLVNELIDKFENCFFDENKFIVWNKPGQKIYEIKKLFVGKNKFHWEM